MKMSPVLRALAAHQPPIPAMLVHTGQHCDQGMNHPLFEDLGLPRPDLNLEVGSGSHAAQTAEVMRRFELVLDEHRPSCVRVGGDVNSTLACTLMGRDADATRQSAANILRGEGKRGRVPELWDSHAADRIAADLYNRLHAGAP